MKIENKYSRLIPSIFKGTNDGASFLERYLKIFEDIIDGKYGYDVNQVNRLDIISDIFHPDFKFLFEVFCWDEVPGNDDLRLKEYLSKILKIDQKNFIKIEKSNDGGLITVFYEKPENGKPEAYLKTKIELKLDEEGKKVQLRTDDAAINLTFASKIRNGKRRIYFFNNKDFLPRIEEEHEQIFENYFSTGIDDFLVWFAEWMGLSLKVNWDIETKRKLIAKIIPLYRMRGTKIGLEEYLKICTGYNDIKIIDEMKSFQVGIISTVGKDTILGGLRPNHFIVNIKTPEYETDIQSKKMMIEELVKKEKPVHTTFELNFNHI